MSGKCLSRTMEDMDEAVLSYAEIKAIAAGNPMIRRKMELEMEISRLKTLESQFNKTHYQLEDAILKHFPKRMAAVTERIKGLETDTAARNRHFSSEFSIRLGSKTFDERKDAGELLLGALKSGKYEGKTIGSIHGFDLIAANEKNFGDPVVYLKGALTYKITLSGDAVGSMVRLENAVKGLDKELEAAKQELDTLRHDIETAKTEFSKTFDHTDKLKELGAELSTVNASLDLDKKPDEAVLDEEENDNSEEEESEDILDLEDEDECEMAI